MNFKIVEKNSEIAEERSNCRSNILAQLEGEGYRRWGGVREGDGKTKGNFGQDVMQIFE